MIKSLNNILRNFLNYNLHASKNYPKLSVRYNVLFCQILSNNFQELDFAIVFHTRLIYLLRVFLLNNQFRQRLWLQPSLNLLEEPV